jgi:hypothetical protein
MGAVVFWSVLGLASGMGATVKHPDAPDSQPKAAAEAN